MIIQGNKPNARYNNLCDKEIGVDIENLSRFATAFISVIASIGIVYFHMHSSGFYIGSSDSGLDLNEVLAYWKRVGSYALIHELFKGSCAVIGLFLIISGYGLSKKYSTTLAFSYLLYRFKKVYLYALLTAITCTFIVFFVNRRWIFSYWHSFTLLFGFYDRFPRDRATMQYWYLSLALTYYLVFVTVRNVKSTGSLLFLSLVLSYAFGIFILLQPPGISIKFLPDKFVSIYHSSICRFPEFVAGMFLARHKTLEKFCFRFSYTSLAFGLIWVLIGYFSFFSPVSYLSAHFIYSTGLFFFLSQLAGFFVRWPIFKRLTFYLSEGTFTLYGLHLVTIDYVFKFFKERIGNNFSSGKLEDLSSGLFLSLCCILVLVVGNRLESFYRSAIDRIWPGKVILPYSRSHLSRVSEGKSEIWLRRGRL